MNCQIPQNAAKDHNFAYYGLAIRGNCFVCSKCKVWLFVPSDQAFWNRIPTLHPDKLKLFKQLNCCYYYIFGDWNTVFNISFLSCDEMRIRDIIL